MVIDAEAVSDLDTTGVGVLDDLHVALQARGITLVLARVKAPVRAYLERAGLLDQLGQESIFLEVDDGGGRPSVRLARRSSG
jgi:SulP family sulfate permease